MKKVPSVQAAALQRVRTVRARGRQGIRIVVVSYPYLANRATTSCAGCSTPTTQGSARKLGDMGDQAIINAAAPRTAGRVRDRDARPTKDLFVGHEPNQDPIVENPDRWVNEFTGVKTPVDYYHPNFKGYKAMADAVWRCERADARLRRGAGLSERRAAGAPPERPRAPPAPREPSRFCPSSPRVDGCLTSLARQGWCCAAPGRAPPSKRRELERLHDRSHGALGAVRREARLRGPAHFSGVPYTEDPAELAGFDAAIVGAPMDELVPMPPGPATARERSARQAARGPHMEARVDAIGEVLKVVDFGDAPIVPADPGREPRGDPRDGHARARRWRHPDHPRRRPLDRRARHPGVRRRLRARRPRALRHAHRYRPHRLRRDPLARHADVPVVEAGAVDGTRYAQVGLRGYWPGEEEFGWQRERGISSFPMHDVRGPRASGR